MTSAPVGKFTINGYADERKNITVTHDFGTGSVAKTGNVYYFDQATTSAEPNLTWTGGALSADEIYIFAVGGGGGGYYTIGGGGGAFLFADLSVVTVGGTGQAIPLSSGISFTVGNGGMAENNGDSTVIDTGSDTVTVGGGLTDDLSGSGGAGGTVTFSNTYNNFSIWTGGAGGADNGGSGTVGGADIPSSISIGTRITYFSGGGGSASNNDTEPDAGGAGGNAGGGAGGAGGSGGSNGSDGSPGNLYIIGGSPNGNGADYGSGGSGGGETSGGGGGGGGGGYGGGGGGGAGASVGSGAPGAVFLFVVGAPPDAPAPPTLAAGGTAQTIIATGSFTGTYTNATFYLYDSSGTLQFFSSSQLTPSNDEYTDTFTSVPYDTEYTCKWTLTNAFGEGIQSNDSAPLTLTEPEPEPEPSQPAAPDYAPSSNSIDLTGNAAGVTGAFTSATFDLYLGATASGSPVDTLALAGANGQTIFNAVFTGLSPSTQYTVTWFLSGPGGDGMPSDPVTFYTTSGGGGGNPICFLRGSKILCLNGQEEYMPIEEMQVGTLVKTLSGAFVKVHTIGKTIFKNPDNADRGPNRLFKLSPKNYPQLTEDLIITGCHSILVDKLEPKQKARHLQLMKTLYMTTGKFRLMAFIDEKAEPYQNPGDHEIWHFALENEEVVCNYGVYANGGLLVESASIKTMRERGGLVLIE